MDMKINSGLSFFRKKISSDENKKIGNNTFNSNPFGLSFRGKKHVGDIFSSPTDKSKNLILEKGKIAASAVISSLVKIKNTFKTKIQPIVDFANQTKAQIANATQAVSSFRASDLKISNLIKKEDPYPNLSKPAKKLVTKDVGELEEMWLAMLAKG